jgi:hypothetical protein
MAKRPMAKKVVAAVPAKRRAAPAPAPEVEVVVEAPAVDHRAAQKAVGGGRRFGGRLVG